MTISLKNLINFTYTITISASALKETSLMESLMIIFVISYCVKVFDSVSLS